MNSVNKIGKLINIFNIYIKIALESLFYKTKRKKSIDHFDKNLKGGVMIAVYI